MPYVTTSDGVDIFYKDWGPKDAQPIMFHHGWPLSSDDWDNQMLFFLQNGYRVVARPDAMPDIWRISKSAGHLLRPMASH
jgi:pimeloyl-ACP methyl ester carboxylesterase